MTTGFFGAAKVLKKWEEGKKIMAFGDTFRIEYLISDLSQWYAVLNMRFTFQI